MADFQQSRCVATLHRLDTKNQASIERQLEAFAERRPIALVLPCLFSEFSRPAIGSIVEHLERARFIDTVVLVLGKASVEELCQAKAALARLPQRVTIIWNDGPHVQAFYDLLRQHDLDVGGDGKGRSCWLGYGQVLAEGRCQVIAAHDCDITTYDGELLQRLCYPVVHPTLGYEFAKGYYARVNGTLNGRVTRLFIAPLLQALDAVLGRLPLLDYLGSFRYPLSGEFAMTTTLARVNRIPCNWGLEVGVLAEVYRNCALPRICQTEVCAVYDHKHQALAIGDATTGLLKMAVEVGQTLLRALAAEAVVLTDAMLKTLLARYVRVAEDAIDAYEADAAVNSLAFDRHREEETVDAFAAALRIASARHLDDPLAVRLMPSWKRVMAAIPGVLDQLAYAVECDSRAAVPA
jgi:glucosyl-3-phosphoglycerate synthase